MTTTYTNSKGQKVEIASMHYAHLVSAHAKAEREYDAEEDESGERAAEIAAMKADIERRDAEYALQEEGEGDGGA